MARTALQIAQDTLAEMGLPQPTALASSTALGDLQALALLNREGKELADMPGSWPALRGEQVFNLVAGQEAYPFPADLLYYRQSTEWDRTTKWRLLGPVSDREWQRFRSSVSVTSPYLRYRVMDGALHFDPVPSVTDQVVFEYVSSFWAQDAGGNAKPAFTADTDTPLLPDDLLSLGLKWRLLAARGMNYAEERATYDAAVERKRARAEIASPLRIDQRGPRFGILGAGMIPDGYWPGP